MAIIILVLIITAKKGKQQFCWVHEKKTLLDVTTEILIVKLVRIEEHRVAVCKCECGVAAIGNVNALIVGGCCGIDLQSQLLLLKTHKGELSSSVCNKNYEK